MNKAFSRRVTGSAMQAAASAALLVVAIPTTAQVYTGQTVATGLNNPRGLGFDDGGVLYIAEAGYGSPGLPANALSFLNNGSITTVSGVTQRQIVSGLPSVYNGEAVTGPSDIVFRGGTGYVLIGFGADPASRPAGSNYGSLVSFTGSGAPTVFDVSGYEGRYNPIDTPDSNPFHAVATSTGFAVTDAGGNTLIGVSPTGATSLAALFPDRYIAPPPYIPMGPPFSQSVPTGVAVGPDGIYVAELTGFPFTPGAAQIYRIATGSTTADKYAGGLTDLSGLAFGLDGALYALEYDVDGLTGPGSGGALVRVNPNGPSTTLFTGLTHPTDLAVGPDGAFYVTDNGDGGAGAGTVVRITAAVPEPATWVTMIGGLGLIGGALRRMGARRRTAPI